MTTSRSDRARRRSFRHGAEARRRIAYLMRMGGSSYAEIGEWLGVGPQRAHQVVRAKDREIGRAAFWLQALLHGEDPCEWRIRQEEAEQIA